ncbi:MAG: hypothetical protein OXC31_09605 [Spirochaetaceae bacterium]|nr:hypothetical protein [Spirochaetaceae bacterium]
MSDLDALRAHVMAERDAARTAVSVCAAEARVEWLRDRSEACPEHLIPTPSALAKWLPECPADGRSGAADLLDAVVDALPSTAALPNLMEAMAKTTSSQEFMTAVIEKLPSDHWAREAGPYAGPLALMFAWMVIGEAPITNDLWRRTLNDPAASGFSAADGHDTFGRMIERIQTLWLEARKQEPALQHPLAPLIAAWQRLAPMRPAVVTVTATATSSPMARRPALVSTSLRTPWVSAVTVDDVPMLARIPDPGEILDAWNRPAPRRQFRPNDLHQTLRPLGVPPIPYDLRLAALAVLDPRYGLIDDTTHALTGDVLTLLAYAHAVDRPLILTDREGAALLARTRTGDFRRPQESDIERFRRASAHLRALVIWPPDGSSRWLDLAHVSPTRDHVGGWSVEIGPPRWARPIDGKWTLTAEGSTAGRLRPTAGEGSMAGRIITGLEYRLAARIDGRPGVAPDLRPVNGRPAGPGRLVSIRWRDVLRLAGDYWDPSDPYADNAARKRFDRAIVRIDRIGYRAANLQAEAPAGDSVEVMDVTVGTRTRPASLVVRASARFVEAARKAHLRDGGGFEPLPLVDYVGMSNVDHPAQ